MMTDEDRTVSKLKGENVLIKFKDGEELCIRVDLGEDSDDEAVWFTEMEDFLNNKDVDHCSIPNLALTRDTIKYIRRI